MCAAGYRPKFFTFNDAQEDGKTSDIIVSGRHGHNSVINGAYDRRPERKNGGRTVYFKSADGLYLYWHPAKRHWSIGKEIGGTRVLALNRHSASSPDLCPENEWHVWDGSHFVLDAAVRVGTKASSMAAFVYGDFLPTYFKTMSRFEIPERRHCGNGFADSRISDPRQLYYY